MPQNQSRLVIMGAAGRDFHDFNVYWKRRADVDVVCFTATQIPDISGRRYPAALAGPRYPDGIPIRAEEELEQIIREHDVDEVALAYSDLPYDYVMHRAALVSAAGASFRLLGASQTMLRSTRPVIAVCAVRTGCGKSQVSRRVSHLLRAAERTVAVVRHPMPYGDLEKQVCQRFAAVADLDRYECTIEEREEYEPHIALGNTLFAGIDYEQILRAAEAEAEVVLWDGGNNDTPFFAPTLLLVVVDPHRPGHECSYYPGETNLRMADAVIVNKVDTAEPAAIDEVESNVRRVNPGAPIIRARSPVTVDDASAIRGRRVLVVEDGPTVTHGDMAYGAGHVAARREGATEIIDPRPFASGTIRAVYDRYDHLTDVLPAMGYGPSQMAELERTINAADCDAVVIGTPIDLGRLLKLNKPAVRVRYELEEEDPSILPRLIEQAVAAPVRT